MPTYRNDPFVRSYLNIILLFFPLTAFLVMPSIQGTTIMAVFGGLLFGLALFLPLGEVRYALYRDLFYFAVIWFLLSFSSQMTNLITGLKLEGRLELINRADYLKTFYRVSHLTQSLYLIMGFLIYLIIKYFSGPSTIKYVFWGLRLLCLYAMYEFLYYMLTGQNGDFVTNRTFGYNEKTASLFQTVNIGGISLMRLKGYTGEPSMFTFTVVPYWILAFALNRKLDIYLILGCLVLTFSTTAYFVIAVFLAFWFLHKRQYKLVIGAGFALVAAGVMLQLEPFSGMFKGVMDFVFADKLSGDTMSARSRGGHFETHILYWAGMDLVHQLVGIGFGYVRSTDFFSTLFVNTGFLGFLAFTVFVFRHAFIPLEPRDLRLCYRGGLLAVYAIMMATVPEFSYPSLWIYLGLGFLLKDESIKDESVKTIVAPPSRERLAKRPRPVETGVFVD